MTIYTPEIAATVCERLAFGESLRAICRDKGMPAASTVIMWALTDRDGFCKHYMRAREIQAYILAEQIREIADDGSNDWTARRMADGSIEKTLDHEHVTRSRLRVDALKWTLAKQLPKVFGDRVQTDAQNLDAHGNPVDPPVPVVHVTVSRG